MSVVCRPLFNTPIQIFAVAGHVQSVKIIPDRNFSHGGLNYGFVEYTDMRAAETALQTLNGRKIFDTGTLKPV